MKLKSKKHPKIQVRELLVRPCAMSIYPDSIMVFYTYKIESLYANGEPAKAAPYDSTHDTGTYNYDINTLIPIAVDGMYGRIKYLGEGTRNPGELTSYAEDFLEREPKSELQAKLLEEQTPKFKEVCDRTGILENWIPIKTNIVSRATDWYYGDFGGNPEKGYTVNVRELSHGEVLKKSPEFQRVMNNFVKELKKEGLIMNNIKTSAKTNRKVKEILDSLFPECDIDMKEVEGEVKTESSSRVGKVLAKLKVK